MSRLRFAVLFDGESLERWHLLCLEHLEQVAELAGVMVAPAHASAPPRRAASILMRAFARRVDKRSTVRVAERFADVPRLSAESADPSVESAALDFVLKLGHGSIPAGLESAARHGVWYFEHESETDLLPFFSDVNEGRDVTRAALLALSARSSEPALVEEGFFATEKRSYVANRDRVLVVAAEWPARVCRLLLASTDPAAAGSAARAVQSPSRAERRARFLPFLESILQARLAFAWARLFRHPQWNIGVLNKPVGALLAPGAAPDGSIDWLPLDDREGFLADPFAIEREGKLHVLYKYFGYREGKGRICTLEYGSADAGAKQPDPALTLPVHMSYPFLLEDSGEVYCIPETSEAGEVALFRAVEFPHHWSRVGVLVEGFAGVDPTVFRHDGRWWLTCTPRGPRADVELWVWHALELTGPWTPHTRNPVKTDVRSARPGGTPFLHEGALYRPAQDCSKHYGWRVTLQRITRLTPSDFAEEGVMVLEASPGSPFPHGRHTFTPVGDVILVDGLRTVLVWQALRAFLRIWAHDVGHKLRRRD